MGLLDSSNVRNIPASLGWTSATSPSFTNTQTVAISNPGGYRTLKVKLTLNGGSWDDIYITLDSNNGIMFGDDGILLNRIEREYKYITIDANYRDVSLYAVSSDGIAGKTISYEYLWEASAPLASDIKPVQLVSKSQITLATGTTSYNFKLLGTSNAIDITPFKYFFFSLESKEGSSLKRLTYSVDVAKAFKEYIGDSNTIRAIYKTQLSCANDYLVASEWLPVESPLILVRAVFDAAKVVDGAIVNLLLYGVR